MFFGVAEIIELEMELPDTGELLFPWNSTGKIRFLRTTLVDAQLSPWTSTSKSRFDREDRMNSQFRSSLGVDLEDIDLFLPRNSSGKKKYKD